MPLAKRLTVCSTRHARVAGTVWIRLDLDTLTKDKDHRREPKWQGYLYTYRYTYIYEYPIYRDTPI